MTDDERSERKRTVTRQLRAGEVLGQISQSELTVRMLETYTGMPRPSDGRTAVDLLDGLDETFRDSWLAVAKTAMHYFAEALKFDVPSDDDARRH